MTHELGKLPNVAGVGLQEPGAEGAPEVVRLYLSLLDAALADPGVEPSPQGVLRHPLALFVEEEVGRRRFPSGHQLVADL